MPHLTLSDAKQHLRIPDLWRRCGLPGEPRKSCHCPFHDDHSASFSVSPDGLLWNCFAGCGGGDAVDFFQRARGLSQADACREFLRLAGGGFVLTRSVNRCKIRSATKRATHSEEVPSLAPGSEADRRTLATLRNVSLEAIALTAQRGLLAFGEWKGRAAWFVTDSTKRNTQARRMDGEPWSEIGGKKAWTICAPGNAKWPVGANEAQSFHCLALCEGGPDLLAAFHFIVCEGREADSSAVTMLGASLDIHADALSLFAGKRIRIFGHDDSCKQRDTGRNAVELWAEQLTRAGADVDAFNFAGLRKVDGSLVKDLNDCTSVCPDDFEANRTLWRMLP